MFNRDREARKEVLAVYNKRRSDFDNVQEFNEYLTMIEDKIDVLMYGGPQEQNKVRAELEQEKPKNQSNWQA